jgi:hypothetical protein
VPDVEQHTPNCSYRRRVLAKEAEGTHKDTPAHGEIGPDKVAHAEMASGTTEKERINRKRPRCPESPRNDKTCEACNQDAQVPDVEQHTPNCSYRRQVRAKDPLLTP